MIKSLTLALLALAAGSTPAMAQEAAGGPLSIEPGLMIWTVVVFILLLVVLGKFAWPQVLGAVEAREKALEQQLAEAERNRAESARMLEEQKKLLAEARSTAHQIVAEAKGLGEKERAVQLERAREEHEALLERARREIDAERERAVADLRREAVDLSLAAASKLIGERMDSEADRRLVVDYLNRLETQH